MRALRRFTERGGCAPRAEGLLFGEGGGASFAQIFLPFTQLVAQGLGGKGTEGASIFGRSGAWNGEEARVIRGGEVAERGGEGTVIRGEPLAIRIDADVAAPPS